MSLEVRLQDLHQQLGGLHKLQEELRLCIAEDKPHNADVLLTERLNDTVEELSGWLAEAAEAAQDGCQAMAHPADYEAARLALLACQERCNRLMRCFADQLAGYEPLRQLMHLGQRRGREWQAWVNIVRDNVERCREPMEELRLALLGCWQELAERATYNAVLIQSRNIGQQIVASPESLPAQIAVP